jgi:hypothetical protein
MGSGAVIYVPSFIKTGSGVQRLIWGIHRNVHARTVTWCHKLTLFFKIRKVSKKRKIILYIIKNQATKRFILLLYSTERLIKCEYKSYIIRKDYNFSSPGVEFRLVPALPGHCLLVKSLLDGSEVEGSLNRWLVHGTEKYIGLSVVHNFSATSCMQFYASWLVNLYTRIIAALRCYQLKINIWIFNCQRR